MRCGLFAAACFAAVTLFTASGAWAIDHDNLDSGRPLRIEDAQSIAFRERALEFGLAPTFPYRARRGSVGLGLSAEYLYGFALNSHLSLDFDPYVGARSGASDQRFDLGNIGVGVFHNINRETLEKPAYAVRADVFLPTGRNVRGVGIRLRGILSRTFKQYSRFHVNADATVTARATGGERSFLPALTLGITRPLGYPNAFNRTGLAELGVRASEERSGGAILSAGVGLRQQVTVRSVFDIGLQSEFAAPQQRPAARESLRLTAGYSTQF